MSEKQDIINRLLEMQAEFIKIEQAGGVTGKQYFDADENSFMHKYRKEYEELSDKLINVAHAEKGSLRE